MLITVLLVAAAGALIVSVRSGSDGPIGGSAGSSPTYVASSGQTGTGPTGTADSGAAGTDPTAATGTRGITSGADPAAVAAAETIIGQLNAEAGGSPAQQRAVLQQLVDPARRANQDSCAAATTTVRLVPSWSAVRTAADGHLILPALIRIFTGARISGTDVAIIDVVVSAGHAYLPPLCIS